jgi:hypothetical protein
MIQQFTAKSIVVIAVLRYAGIERQKISKQIYRRSRSDVELINLAKECVITKHGEELNLTEEELAFVR